jgi:dihydroorotate dehydrogenase electron transfer subunit
VPQQFVARFVEREEVPPIGAIVRLAAPPGVTRAVTPGQFLLLHQGFGESRDPLLARPFSIMRAGSDGAGGGDGGEGYLDLLVDTGGTGGTGRRGTARLASARPGDTFAALGPLGNGYQLGPKVRRALLVAVGHGVAPLVALAEAALARDLEVVFLLGAPTAAQLLPLSHLPDAAEVVVATADGSRGHHGQVTDLVPDYVEWADAICACAPEPLYAHLRDALRRYRGARRLPPVQVAMERAMACGVGVCLGCVVETTSGMRTVCRDGPVFPLDQLVLE